MSKAAGKEVLSIATGVLNSNLYWFFYVVFSSFHHVNPIDILEFPIDFDIMNPSTKEYLISSTKVVMKDLKSKSEIRCRNHKGGSVSKIQTFFPSRSKDLIDKIDRILARYYEFTSEELDFIINYDVKYRMEGKIRGE